MNRLSEWSIAKRISFIAAVLSAGLVVTGALGRFASWRIGDLFASYRLDTGKVIETYAIEAEVFEAKKSEMQYRRIATPEMADRTRAHLSTAIGMAEAAEQGFSFNPTMADAFRRVAQTAGTFGARFDGIIRYQDDIESQSAEARLRG